MSKKNEKKTTRPAKVKALTQPKKAACCEEAKQEAQCCAKASPLVAGCHD